MGNNPVLAASKLKAQINVVDLPQDRPLLTAGFKAVMHIHAVTIDCEIVKINESTSLETGEVEQKPRTVKPGQHAIVMIQLTRCIPIDQFCEATGRLGLLAIRTDGRTVAVGKVI